MGLNYKYLKPLHYVVVAVLGGGAALPLLMGDGLNGVTVVAVLGAVGVYFTRNTPKQPWARVLTASYASGAALLVAAYTDQSVSAVEWQQILLALLGAGVVGGSSDETGPVPVPVRGGGQAPEGLPYPGI